MEPGGESESVLIKLTRMEGKLDLSNQRHDQTDAWKVTVDNRLHTHGNRIQIIEAREHQRLGERQGLATGGKWAWAAIGFVPGAMTAGIALLKLFTT